MCVQGSRAALQVPTEEDEDAFGENKGGYLYSRIAGSKKKLTSDFLAAGFGKFEISWSESVLKWEYWSESIEVRVLKWECWS